MNRHYFPNINFLRGTLQFWFWFTVSLNTPTGHVSTTMPAVDLSHWLLGLDLFFVISGCVIGLEELVGAQLT